MGGGLMQLVAYGAQDIYLTGNPQITFFKVVYRRHTNFAVESIEQTFNGQADFGKRVTATISRNGDLIQQMYLEVILPLVSPTYTVNGLGDVSNVCVWTYGVGNALVKQAEIEIGGQLIDRQYGDWMNIWSELTVPAGKRDGYDVMVGNIPYNQYNYQTLDNINSKLNNQIGGLYANPDNTIFNPSNTGGQGPRLYVPLQFWFNRNPGLALPLIALQYHEVKLNLELRNFLDLVQIESDTVTPTQSAGLNCKLYVDYVYLDTDERRRFAQVSHEYLIEQVQFTGAETIAQNSSNKNITLNFNHPVKELIWVHTSAAHTTSNPDFTVDTPGNCWFNYSGADTAVSFGVADSFQTGLLQLNGHDRFSVRNSDYFRKVQNYEHHTRCPRVGYELGGLFETDNQIMNLFSVMNDRRMQYIYTYSFALSPEEHQPSGTCNFSRIDNAVLQLKYDPNVQTALQNQSLNLRVYAVNYNVLRIMSGMGGLAYSN